MKLLVSLLQPGEAVPKLLSLDLANLGLETYADLLACFYGRLSEKFDLAILYVSAPASHGGISCSSSTHGIPLSWFAGVQSALPRLFYNIPVKAS